MNLGGLLTRKLGPLPTWAYLVGIAGLGFLAYRMGWFGQGHTQTTGPAPAQPALTPLQEAGLLQQLSQLPQSQAAPAPPPAAPSAPSDTPVNAADWVRYGSSFLYRPGGQEAPFIKGGRTYFHLIDPQAEAAYKAAGGTPYFFPSPGLPVPGEQGAIYGVAPATGGEGVGGPRAPRPHRASLVGGRPRVGTTEGLWRPGHPMLRSGDQLHPHFAMGGAAGGSVHAAAAATGLHPARLLALNPHLRAGRARGNQYIRVR